jgi:hypothetical protein
MADGEAGEVSSAPLLLPRTAAAEAKKHHHKGCPGCRLDEANEGKTGVPLLNFFYIWVVCLVACEFFIPDLWLPYPPPLRVPGRALSISCAVIGSRVSLCRRRILTGGYACIHAVNQ